MSVVLAAALFTGDVPEVARQKRLAAFFSPAPGAELVLSEHDRRDYGPGVSPLKMRGHIMVKPPPHVCLTIMRSPDADDLVVCKETQVSFTLEDLDDHAKLHWQVTTGEGDFGTELSWPTPYHVAIVVPPGDDKTPLDHKYIDSCEPVVDFTGRRIRVHLLTGETWVIRFPQHDRMPPQPRSLANLEAIVTMGKIGVGDAAEAQKADAARDKAEAAESGEKKEGEKKDGGEASEKPVVKEDPVPYERDDRKEWAIPLRGAYTMSSDHFQPYGSVTPGLRGLCRYYFNGSKDDPDTGRIECHDVDGYQSVYMALTCLRQIGPEK